jgi:hypothetical protein
MSRQRLVDAQPNMLGGLNETSDESALAVNQLRQAKNARLTEYGAATKRGGLQRVSSALVGGVAVLNGAMWRKDVGTPEILAVADGKLFTTTYGTSFPFTWTQQTGTLSTTVSPTMTRFRDGVDDVIYIGDGGQLNKWNGTALTVDIIGTVGASMITVHNERLWSCGCAAAPQSIFYSALNNGDTLGNASAGGGEIIVRTFGDENTVALASVNTSLLIFHRRGISRLTGFGQDDITVAPAGISEDVGLIAPKSIVVVNNLAYFISERGLYVCNEADITSVSSVETPDPLLAAIQTMNSQQFDRIRAVLNRRTRELMISLPDIGVYIYHTALRAWSGPWDTGWVSPTTTALWEVLDNSGLPVVLRGDSDGFVSLTDATINLDNVAANGTGGVRYPMTVQFHRMFCGDQALSKALRWGYLTAQLRGSDQCRVEWSTGDSQGSFSLPPSADQTWGGAGTTWGNGSWGGAGSKNYRIPMGGSGFYVDVTVIDSGETRPLLSSFQLETFSLGRR